MITANTTWLVVVGNDRAPVPVLIRYSEKDPVAVHVEFSVGQPKPVEWDFARVLLTASWGETVGDGDVRIKGARPHEAMEITLSSPYGEARFLAPQQEITEFLRQTYELVPEDQEDLDIDTAIQRLLDVV